VLWDHQARKIEEDERLQSLVQLQLLGVSSANRPLLITEGKNDPDFLRRIAGLFDINTSRLALMHSAGRFPESVDQGNYIASLIREATGTSKPNVSVLRDRDFRMLPKSNEGSTLRHFWWDQPAIESYLFLYHCGKWSKERKSEQHPFTFLRDATLAAEFATKYFHCFKYRDPKGEGAFIMFERWATAMAAAYKDAPTESDFRAVAAVVHGHLWWRRCSARLPRP
jgi:hypothetical protein